jgi:oligoribonuclease NrnB/cAMP/cGMP phosphodiesterase (DHH superfamily)
MKQRVFIYHGNCFDGFTASWVFNRFFKPGLNDAPVEYVGAHYGDEPPDCKGKEVWMVDISFDRETMIEKIIKPSTRTVVMDHHKTAEAALKGILDEVRDKHRLSRKGDEVVFDMHRCGSGILYDYLDNEAGKLAGFHKPRYNGNRELWLVDYIEDRDLWKKKLPDTEEVHAYLASIPMTFNNWDAANALGRMNVVEAGRSIKRYIDLYGVKARQQARFEDFVGYRVPTLNIPYMNCSEYVNELLNDYPEAPFALSYYRANDGTWRFSLRSKGEFDVSSIATQFGGGGHRNAAGFSVAALPFGTAPVVPADRIEAV